MSEPPAVLRRSDVLRDIDEPSGLVRALDDELAVRRPARRIGYRTDGSP